MTLIDLQVFLKATNRYAGAVDGQWGRLTEAGVLLALTDGPDTALTEADFQASAQRLACPVIHIKAVAKVEASGAGFFAGRPVILFEPHRFSRATKGRFDRSNPAVSYPRWDPKRYPKTQDGRYDQLLEAVSLDVDAGFASASYGKFQILGENHRACGFDTPFAFAVAMARDEARQLKAFEGFISSTRLLRALQAGDWTTFARGFNGSAFRVNRYDARLAEAAASFGRA